MSIVKRNNKTTLGRIPNKLPTTIIQKNNNL